MERQAVRGQVQEQLQAPFQSKPCPGGCSAPLHKAQAGGQGQPLGPGKLLQAAQPLCKPAQEWPLQRSHAAWTHDSQDTVGIRSTTNRGLSPPEGLRLAGGEQGLPGCQDSAHVKGDYRTHGKEWSQLSPCPCFPQACCRPHWSKGNTLLIKKH